MYGKATARKNLQGLAEPEYSPSWIVLQRGKH
jgi:hypothetical protein